MKLNSKGQVTIPAALRRRHGLVPGDEVQVVDAGDTLRIVRVCGAPTSGQEVVAQMKRTATTTRTTDELMELLRGE
ncbi:MAG TPA: AbrB/MazE/SpoVT family DNA-binding domain-containing protein [Nocardioides sp.]|uniref:AbrB/MazE/SpoVT family DNA-binding domain-containing protein n=1 Tax=uncultured Nocardioides sp. TaxID=198441 RepID=UPI000EE0A6AC|nr:AbrB/MazE/SpoVT family DNA-binding domain-containing protein [uncultured Nocardioides sp.]HCB04824.1 AbrB family transcriptional regulator [Nocardioides sp.]HRD62163.1 AbrB/MazE/SpoVT family DNA-binding domain-containing protein [Nocardioides sp.]HRI94789.1 AbrB/MazE/SpoVT family DNA-binding domain-containing protein [Nocardioides sp.]HRK45155.1 AbrB/MazE/SpoVT family DNA-binding domain-containing protein [Nocardioides sp.]